MSGSATSATPSGSPGAPGSESQVSTAGSKAALKPIGGSSKSRAEYRPDIDGIRGAAAIMVMGFHAKVPGFEGAYIGLDLFFVVSGYVITGLLWHEYEKTGGIKWGAFYARRARRLIPAKATMLIGVLILSYFVMSPTGSQQETARSAVAAAGFVSNIFFWQASDIDYFGHAPGTGVLLHTWSLSVEEQFYLALPILLLLAWLLAKLARVHVTRTLLLTTLALGAASSWLAISWATTNPDAAYYLPMTRAFEFLLGVALALVARKVTLPVDLREIMGLVGAGICAYVLWRPMPVEGYPSYWALLPCVGAALMVWAGVGSETAITKFLSMRFLVGLGLVSYGWYLWHWPLLVMGESVNLAPPPLWGRVGLVLVALGVAYLSYRFVEGVFYKRSGAKKPSRTWGAPRVVVTGVIAMTTVASLAGGAFALSRGEAESPQWQAVQDQLVDVPSMPDGCLATSDEYIPSQPVRCDLVPYERDRPSVVLWGDSHAWMYIPALEAAAADQDVNLIAVVMGGCPPFLPPESLRLACGRSNRLALNVVTKLSERRQPVRVIMGAAWENYRGSPLPTLMEERAPNEEHDEYVATITRYFEAGSPKLFDRLGGLDIDVDVVGPTATIKRNAPLCEARARPYSCDVARAMAIRDEDETVTWLREQMKKLPDDSRFIDVTRSLCDETTCYAEIDGVVNYFDDNHLSATLSRNLQQYFEPTVEAVVAAPQRGDGKGDGKGDGQLQATGATGQEAVDAS